MAKRSATILINHNGIHDEYQGKILIPPNAEKWYQWLESNKSFHFDNFQGSFTANKDKKGYWTASKKDSCKLKRKRLGLSEAITLKKLEDTCLALNSKKILAHTSEQGLREYTKELLALLVKANTRIYELEKELEKLKS
ncbi:MAG: hypothetical protein QNJ34_10525 [Xenococcaceae cyanobacterium MO_188.B29]|nr:hypothetical protein [Xenococcaceae cyanobacterium MO_188.B29]